MKLIIKIQIVKNQTKLLYHQDLKEEFVEPEKYKIKNKHKIQEGLENDLVIMKKVMRAIQCQLEIDVKLNVDIMQKKVTKVLNLKMYHVLV